MKKIYEAKICNMVEGDDPVYVKNRFNRNSKNTLKGKYKISNDRITITIIENKSKIVFTGIVLDDKIEILTKDNSNTTNYEGTNEHYKL